VSNPSNGTLNFLKSDGSFRYTPNAGFNGTDSFTYKAKDGTLDSNVATVTITVKFVNDPPKAKNDSYSTDEDDVLTEPAPGVLANDTDADGDPLTAIKVDNTSNGTLTLNSDGSFTYKPNLNYNGPDSFTYMARDGTADSNVATVTITVNPVADPPIADAGPDQTVDEDITVTLGGSNSFDTEGENLSYQWDQIAGRPVSLSDPQAANPTFTAPSSVGSGGDSLIFQLTVTDEEASQATDTTIVNVTLPLANGPPNADAGVDQTVGEDTTVALDGSNSFDPDGDKLSYQWNQVAGPSVTLSDPTADKPTFEAPFIESAGLSFTFELTVADTSGLQATDTNVVNVTLPFGNSPPIAVVGDDQTADEDTTVTLDGFGSFDPEGQNLSYRWRQVAGRPVTLSDPSAEQPTITAPNVGSGGVSLLFELTATDVGGLQAVVDTLVNVTGDNDFPIADAGNDQAVDENSTITLDGSGSVDPEGENLSYVWRQVAGPSVTLSNPTAEQTTFTAPNVTPNGVSLTFELTVIDVSDLQSRNNTEISVFGNNDLPRKVQSL
jgi:VCBS repeat-containing protein